MVWQSVTYTAKVSPAAATGTVAFDEAGMPIPGCAAQPVGSGTAMCTLLGYAAAGTNSITAIYSGDGNYLTSTSSSLKQVVDNTGTTKTATALSSSLDPSTVGEGVTYTATVSPAAATGAVAFDEAGTPIAGCTAQPVSSGTAMCTVTNLAAGGHWITAVYSGDINYLNSTSPGLTQTVNKKATTMTVSSSLNPSTFGEGVTYTATLNTTAATGTVTFQDGGTTIPGCNAQTVNNGNATCTVADPTAGGHWIKAIYNGDNNYTSSSSSGFTQTVNKKASATALSSSLDPSTVGQSVTYTATVSSATATGTAEFQEEGTPITGCTAETISSGTATCTVTGYPSWSSYTITAAYSGDSSYLASVSPVLTQRVEPPPVVPGGPFRFFSPSSFWNEEVPSDAELDPNSSSIVEAFNEQISSEQETKSGPSIATTDYSVPIYTVPADQPMVPVKLLGHSTHTALRSAFEAVPLPPNAQPAAGTDKHLVVWQLSTNRLWEFWRIEKTAEGWQTEWGGAMQNVSSNPGVYGPEAWPGAESSWGGDASSLSLAGGLVTLEDLEDGEINHALAMVVPNVRAGVYASPAQRTDGYSDNQLSLPEGAHLRLDPNLNLAALHLPRFTLMIAEAAQRYGIFVRSSALSNGIVAFYGQDPTPTGTDPYPGHWQGESSVQILDGFPWNRLQLLKMELHSSS
jgi:hypothetical protein